MAFEVNLGSAFQVTQYRTTIIEERESGVDTFPPPEPLPAITNRLVQTDQSVVVRSRWRVRGGLAAIIEGSWRVQVFLEQFGGGEATPGEYSTTLTHVQSLDNTYDVQVTIPANAIGEGFYRLAVAITMRGPAPAELPLPVAGFDEIGMLQYYTAA